jgi:hypothetical protein
VVARDAELPAGFEDLRGRVFQGRYEIDEIVHASPWRVTYAGRERDAQGGVVLELVRPSRRHDQATLERFGRRVAASKRVRHPAVVGPSDAGELADGKLWVLGERPVGETLAGHLQRQASGRLDWMDARPLLLELVRGLGAAHARRVVHGSLNPSCCWVDRPDFGAPSLRVSGFGVNVCPAADDESLGHSRTTALAYDAVFMAPETAGGIFGDERSDVYLAGLVAWFMLVGQPPFQAANPFQNAGMHLTAPLTAMRDAGVDVPASVEELVRSMLAKKPQQRIGGMAEVEQVLLGFAEGGEAREAGAAVEPAARGRGRARAQRAGAASREEAVQRLAGKGGSGGAGRGGMPRLPGQEIVDPRRGAEPRRAPVGPRAGMPVVAAPVSDVPPLVSPPYEAPRVAPQARDVPPVSSYPQYVAPPMASPPYEPPPLVAPQAHAIPPMVSHAHEAPPPVRTPSQPPPRHDPSIVEATEYLERPALIAAAASKEEHTAMLTSQEVAEVLWSDGHDPDEGNPDATMMLILPETAAPHGRASKAVRVVQEDQRPIATSRSIPGSPSDRRHLATPVVPVVTGGTEWMSPEDVRMLRLAGLAGRPLAAPSPTRTAEPGVDATQMLEIERDGDLDEQQTTALSPEQVRAFRRELGKRRPGEE